MILNQNQPLDQNLIAVEWGVLSAFGVVVGLLIPQADSYYRAFRADGLEENRERAIRWALATRLTAVAVLLSLIGLGFLGAHDAPLILNSLPSTNFWLLLTPVIAQGLLILLVFSLVRWPPGICQQPLDPCSDPLPTSPQSYDRSTLRVINRTSQRLDLYWIDFEGHSQPLGRDGSPVAIAPTQEVVQRTFTKHIFMVADPIKKESKQEAVCRGIIKPESAVVKVVIRKSDLEPRTEDSPSG
jgi:hypothetical protein